jgi:hypothetical protein
VLTYETVLQRAPWRPIPDCPGRHVLRGLCPSFEELLGEPLDVEEHHVAATEDAVLVVRFAGGGLITFRKPDGTLVHTLNTEEGLRRRLAKLGIAFSAE